MLSFVGMRGREGGGGREGGVREKAHFPAGAAAGCLFCSVLSRKEGGRYEEGRCELEMLWDGDRQNRDGQSCGRSDQVGDLLAHINLGYQRELGLRDACHF